MKKSSGRQNRRKSPLRSSLSELHKVLDDSLKVRHISVQLATCSPNEPAREVRERMEKSSFDVLGVRENNVIGQYVRRNDLASGKCYQYQQVLEKNDVVADTMSLVKLLPRLRDRSWIFVRNQAGVSEITTRADLQKPPVRMLLFGLISLLETYLVAMMRVCYPDRSFENLLKSYASDRLAEAKRRFAKRVARNEENDLADCLLLSDKLDLLLRVGGLREFFELGDPAAGEFFASKLETLRNNLAHADDLVSCISWEDVFLTTNRVELVLDCYEKNADEFEKRFAP